jgi:hypothetical protein
MALLERRILYGIWILSIPNANPIRYPEAIRLLVILVSLVVNDVEELELVNTLAGRDDTEPVTELHLLEELLGPVREKKKWLAGRFQERVGAKIGVSALTGT